MKAQLVHDIGPVPFHGFRADAQHVGNFPAGISFGRQFQHFPLPLGQGVPGSFLFHFLPAFQVSFHDFFSNSGADVHFIGQDHVNRLDQFFLGGIFQTVSGHPGFKAFQHKIIFIVNGQGQDPDVRQVPLDLLDGRQSVHPGHGQIHHDQVRRGFQFENGIHGLHSVAGLGHDLEGIICIDHQAQAFPEQGVVIDNHNLFGFHVL